MVGKYHLSAKEGAGRRRRQTMSEERSRRERDESVPARDDRDEAERRRATTRKEQDVLLDVSELEVEKITLEVAGLRAHVSVLAQLASLVNLQVGVDARLNRVKLEIEGVRAKVLLKVWLDEVRAILEKALDTLGEHPEILESLIKAINELLQGRLGDALGALEGVLEGLEEGDTVDALLKGRLEDVRAALEQVLEQVGVDEGESRVAIGEGPSDDTGESAQDQER
jgi:hypothetical protein